jgi:hypothetical protein
MPEVTGTVERVSSKQLASGLYYSFLVNDEWYRTNKTKPPFDAGYKVKFTFNEDKYGKQVDVDSVKFKEGEAPAGGTAGGAATNSKEYWANREANDLHTQRRISYQGAINTAVSIVDLMFDKGLIELPKSKKVDEKIELVHNLVLDEAKSLFTEFMLLTDNYDTIMGNEEEVQVQEEPEQKEADDDGGW